MKVINNIKCIDSKKCDSVIINHKQYYVCHVCGRLSFRKIVSNHQIWCEKHYKQYKKYGHAIDDNPRSIADKNEIRVDGKTAYMDLYDQKSNVIATTIIDADDVEKVRYIKWKLSASGYVMNTPKHSTSNIHLSRLILNTDQFVDHINHNPLDNRKCNLRIVTKSQNQMNVNYKGVRQQKNGKYYAYIKLNQHMYNLGVYVDQEEALFARWDAEKVLFKEYAYPKQEPKILESRKKEIMQYVNKKVQRL